MPSDFEPTKVDFRMYIGMLFFRWQLIAIFFLYCVLGGVLYAHLCPKEYLSKCSIMFFRDPNTILETKGDPYASYPAHRYLMESEALTTRVVKRLADKWSKQIGGPARMALKVNVKQSKGLGPTLDISVNSSFSPYGEDFLKVLLEVHQDEWQGMAMESSASAIKLLEKELASLEEKIKASEDDLVEYERLNDVTRLDLKARDESAYLQALIARRRSLSTELMVMEHFFPALRNASGSVITEVAQLTRETGAVKAAPDREGTAKEGSEEQTSTEGGESRIDRSEEAIYRQKVAGWQRRKLELAGLQAKEQELLKNLKPEHPEVRTLRSKIADLQKEIGVAAQIELSNLKDRYSALKIELDAIEAAEYKWSAKNTLASSRMSELKRVANVVSRFEDNHKLLYARLHDTKISEEMKVERFNLVTPISSDPDPVWPDPLKVMLVAVVLGLGSGLGAAVLAHITDNKMQSVRDVEKELGIPHLGGVPFWVHGGLERTIRPIVTEEHSMGAVEAYRALRTTILASLNKMNERIFFVTSADSREGKTLTVLNIAIMIAQMNKKVLLVDLDLRRGRLHRSLGLEKEPGVSNVLKEGLSLRDVIQKTKIDNLFLAPTGSPIEDSAELLQSSDLMNMLVEIQNDYDYICIDTPPVLRVTDTVIMTTQGIGVVVFVARVNHTPKPLIKYSLDMLKDAKVLGLIMNSIEMHKVSSLYYTYQYPNYAYYSNAYAYGHNYYYEDDPKGGARRHQHQRGPKRSAGNLFTAWARRVLLPRD